MTSRYADFAECEIVPECGQWALYLIIYYPDSISRKKISIYRTEKLARIAASLIGRAANRPTRGAQPDDEER